ncbi:LysE family translocator [Acetobacter okinawensis]|uniref:LysE family translocator n=1 Tax=Acetobacter okinawensis TaxID=1076594 RepID=UPI001BAA45D7|nr:LysE family translocator [Acetobacter okinawensis]MBS0965648.1 LysE family translocator [Acetobacter okinawensis]MBS0988281.1 LysE family translocator [Acetobacter okinawensis]
MPDMLLPILTFAAAWGVLVLTPGTETALVIRLGMNVGRSAALGAALGTGTGLALWGVGTAFGVSALVAASPTLYLTLQWAGAIYLAFLGIRLLKPSTGANDQAQADVQARRVAGMGTGYQRGLLTTCLNPLVGVFDLTAFAQFIPAGVERVSYSLLLAGVQVVMAVVWYAVLACLAFSLGRVLSSPKVVRALDMLTGVVFLYFAFRLVLSGLPA